MSANSDRAAHTSAQPSWLSRFQRVTSSGAFLPEIDGLRIFAIGLVFLWHFRTALFETAEGPLTGTSSALSYVVDKGWVGVQLFFAISGFILALPFARSHLHGAPRPRLRDYYLRRLTRLEPPYVVSLVIIFFLKIYLLGASFKSLLPHFFASVLYVHNIAYDDSSRISAVAWSLEVEVQFYIIAPLLGMIFSLRSALLRRTLFCCLGLMAIAAQVIFEARWGFHYGWSGSLAGQLQYFLIGMVLADVYLTHWQSKDKQSSLWDVVAVVGFVSLGIGLYGSPIGYRLAIPPAIFLIYAAALRSKLFKRFLRAPVVSTIGGMCYSIYLLHTWVIFFWYPAIRGLALPPSYPLRFAVFVIPVALAVVLVAGFYFVLLEKPCMDRTWPARLRDTIWRRHKPTQADGSDSPASNQPSGD